MMSHVSLAMTFAKASKRGAPTNADPVSTPTPWIGRRFRREFGKRTTIDHLVHAEPADDPSVVEPSPTAEFLERLTTALLEYGLPVHRLEEAVDRVAGALDVSVDFVCTPTALVLAVGEDDRASMRVVRVRPGGADFARLTALYDLVGRIERRELSPADGSARILAILARPERYGRGITFLAHGLLSLAASVLLGAGLVEVGAAVVLGLSIGAFKYGAAANTAAVRLMPAFASALASGVAYALASVAPEVTPLRLVLASVMVFLPGYATTVGMTELATGNLLSGSARIAGAMARFLMLAVGVALGERVAQVLGVQVLPVFEPSAPIFHGFEFLSPAIAGLASTVLEKARGRDAGWIVLVCYASTLGAWTGGRIFGATLSSFVGAFSAALVSNLVARWRDRPSTVLVTPAILLLVPGGVGFMSMSSLLHRDLDAGLATALRMGLVATCIAAGLLMASLAAPPQRSL